MFKKNFRKAFLNNIYLSLNERKFSSIITISRKKIEQFIENINKPKCKDCVYFYPHKTNKNNDDIIIYNKSFCTKFGSLDIISGKINYYNIIDIRYNTNKCSENGIYFEFKK